MTTNPMSNRRVVAVLAALWLLPAIVTVAPAADNPPAAVAGGDALRQASEEARRDLDASTAELAALRETIKAEKVPMTQELTRLEARLAEVRRQSEDVVRSRDERALEIGNTTAAVKLRQEEMTYISNLLDEYARGFETSVHVSEVQRWSASVQQARLARENRDLSMTDKFSHQVALLKASLERATDLLGGTLFDGEAVDPTGLVTRGRFALVGPVALFAAATGKAAGLALPQAGSSLAAVRALDETLSAGLVGVVTAGEGILPFDPTRGGALEALIHRGSLIGYFLKGGPIMWPLLFVSLLALTVIFERLVFLAREGRNRNEEQVETILAKVSDGDVTGAIQAGEGSKDFVVRSLTYALRHREKSLSNALMRASAQELMRFNRGISILDTCITVAPLLGLLGTVTGMMGSFGMLGGGELSAPAQITGGIAEALIATCFGLGIAVTALIPMNYLHTKSDAARHEMEDAATHLEILMKPILDAEAAVARDRMMSRYGFDTQGGAGDGRPSARTRAASVTATA